MVKPAQRWFAHSGASLGSLTDQLGTRSGHETSTWFAAQGELAYQAFERNLQNYLQAQGFTFQADVMQCLRMQSVEFPYWRACMALALAANEWQWPEEDPTPDEQASVCPGAGPLSFVRMGLALGVSDSAFEWAYQQFAALGPYYLPALLGPQCANLLHVVRFEQARAGWQLPAGAMYRLCVPGQPVFQASNADEIRQHWAHTQAQWHSETECPNPIQPVLGHAQVQWFDAHGAYPVANWTATDQRQARAVLAWQGNAAALVQAQVPVESNFTMLCDEDAARFTADISPNLGRWQSTLRQCLQPLSGMSECDWGWLGGGGSQADLHLRITSEPHFSHELWHAALQAELWGSVLYIDLVACGAAAMQPAASACTASFKAGQVPIGKPLLTMTWTWPVMASLVQPVAPGGAVWSLLSSVAGQLHFEQTVQVHPITLRMQFQSRYLLGPLGLDLSAVSPLCGVQTVHVPLLDKQQLACWAVAYG